MNLIFKKSKFLIGRRDKMKKGMQILILLMVIGTIITMGCTTEKKDDNKTKNGDGNNGGYTTIMAFDVRDGVNKDEIHGCFFTIRAVKGVDIDPSKYFFFVTEHGYSPRALDFSFRDYQDQGEDDLTPVDGDRNKSYRYDDKNWRVENMNVEATGQMWSDGEYIGFDMPMTSMGIDIEEGGIYEVMIKDPSMQIMYIGDFIYQEQAYR